MPQVQFILEADEAKAVNAFLKVVEAQRKSEDGTRKVAKSTDDWQNSLQKVAGMLGIGFGIHAGMQAIVGLAEKYSQYMDTAAQKTNQLRNSLINLAVVAEPGQARQFVSQAAALGVKYGTDQVTAMNVTQAASSLPGKSGAAGLKLAGALLQGSQLGMDPNSLVDFAAQTTRYGLANEYAVMLPFLAGKASQKAPEDMVKAGRALPAWQSPLLAMAAAPEVMAGTNPEDFDIYLRQVGTALNTGEGDIGKLWKRLGVSKGSELEKLKALSATGKITPAELEKMGFKEERQKLGMAAVMRGFKNILPRLDEWPGLITPDAAGLEASRIKGEVPQVAMAEQAQRATTALENEMTLGPTGLRAQAKRAAYARAAKDVTGYKMGSLFYDAQGQPSGIFGTLEKLRDFFGGDQSNSPLGTREYLSDVYQSGVATSNEKQLLLSDLAEESLRGGKRTQLSGTVDEKINQLIRALDANTKATQSNTKTPATSSTGVQTE